jgi:hypothetical protein
MSISLAMSEKVVEEWFLDFRAGGENARDPLKQATSWLL